jgi:thiol:disulfide interchange protein
MTTAPLPEPTETSVPRPHESPRWRVWLARYETPIWIGAMLLLLLFRWPVVKGYYYKLTDAVAPPSAITWRTDVDAALAEARRDGKLVVVDFTADWCPPCLAMKHDVWPDARVARAVAARFVPVLIDTDRDGVTTARYDVESIPDVLVLDAAGAVLDRGAPLTPGGMLGFLDRRSPAR